MSNLGFLGKVIERLVSARLSDVISTHGFSDQFQSTYRPRHSIETALLRVENDILAAMDEGNVTALILLDLSAAFDTVDHHILLSRLRDFIGLRGSALSWCQSYLSNIPQYVRIGDSTSKPVTIEFLGATGFRPWTPVVYSLYIPCS